MAAKYYVYRNLHKGCWSVRYKGKVVEHAPRLYVDEAEFKVNEAGRQRVIAEKKKNVHAFIVSESRPLRLGTIPFSVQRNLDEVTYNPYQYDSFVWADDETRAEAPGDLVLTDAGKVFADRNSEKEEN